MQDSIGNAFVFNSEVAQLEDLLGMPAKSFVEVRRPEHYVLQTRGEGNAAGCVFYRGGLCDIYEARPFDCRLFPFDIKMEPDGTFVWIVYTICPVNFDIRGNFGTAKAVLKRLAPTRVELERYTQKKSLSWNSRKFKVLESVDVGVFTSSADRTSSSELLAV